MEEKLQEKQKRVAKAYDQLIEAQTDLSLTRHQMEDPNAVVNARNLADPDDIDADPSQWGIPQYGSGTTYERECVSPLCNSDGKILDSTSKYASSETKERIRKTTRHERELYGQVKAYPQGSDSSRYDRMKADVDKLVNSPPGSVAEAAEEKEEAGGGVSIE